MFELATKLLDKAELGMSAIFLALMILLFHFMRKDASEHRKEYKETIQQLFNVVDKNTESNTKLSETIGELKDEIKRK